MINLGEWGTIAGSITAIVSLILLVIKPITASFSKITETLSKVNHNLGINILTELITLVRKRITRDILGESQFHV